MFKIIIDDKGDESITEALRARLKAYNESIVGTYQRQYYNIYMLAADGQMIAGLSGSYIGDLAYIDIFWVDETYRGQNLGRQLHTEFEAFARRKSIHSVQLDTAAFQAKGFYEKLGYDLLATIPKGFLGFDYYIFRKVITP